MKTERTTRKTVSMTVWLAAAVATGALALAHESAYADGPPLILDTQRGIIDGKPGVVLQNAPLSREPMVAAPGLAAPGGQATDPSQPYVVAPYVSVPGRHSQPQRKPGSHPHPKRPRVEPVPSSPSAASPQ
jgi:hypothetical protein